MNMTSLTGDTNMMNFEKKADSSGKEKIVIGIRLRNFRIALIISLILAVGLFMPVTGSEVGRNSYFEIVSKLSRHGGIGFGLYFSGAFLMCFQLLFAIISNIKPGKKIGFAWMCISAINTIAITLELFASKLIFDGSGILNGKFLVKDFGFFFWISLIGAYASLAYIMKAVRVHAGYIVLVILSIIWFFPILWIVLTAFRGEGGYYVGYFFPKNLTIDNFIKLLSPGSIIPFRKWWVNTFIVAVCTCLLSTMIILATSYTLSRTRFAGRKTLMKFMLIIGMFPGFMSMIAVYNILKGIGLSQTLAALVIVSAAGSAMGYYICKGFFDTIPKSLDEAATIDGATRWQTFIKITIPLSKPIIIYTILTSFLGPWTDYIFPSMVLGDKQESYTVAVGLKWLTDFQRIDSYYTQFAAGALMVSIPIVILFIVLQRFYVEGLSGSVKG